MGVQQCRGWKNSYNLEIRPKQAINLKNNDFLIERTLNVQTDQGSVPVLEAKRFEDITHELTSRGHGKVYRRLSSALTYLTHQCVTRTYSVHKQQARFELIQLPDKQYWKVV